MKGMSPSAASAGDDVSHEAASAASCRSPSASSAAAAAAAAPRAASRRCSISHALVTSAGVLGAEARRCAVMLAGFAAALGHLHIYPALFGVAVVHPDDVPVREQLYFHHGWTAM